MVELFLTDATLGGEVTSRLSKAETDCARAALGEDVYAAILNLPMTTLVRESGAGEAAVCMANLVADSPNILTLGFGTLDVDKMDENELARLGDESAKFFDCRNSEEII